MRENRCIGGLPVRGALKPEGGQAVKGSEREPGDGNVVDVLNFVVVVASPNSKPYGSPRTNVAVLVSYVVSTPPCTGGRMLSR